MCVKLSPFIVGAEAEDLAPFEKKGENEKWV